MKTKQEVAEIMETVVSEIGRLREAGQAEYAGGENAFGNFERLSSLLNTSREKILLTYFMKHIDGIFAHVNGHVSRREPVEGRINDAIVYLILLRAMVEDNKVSPLSKNFTIDSAINDYAAEQNASRKR